MALSMVCIFLFFTCFIRRQNSVRSSHIAKIEDISWDYLTNLNGTYFSRQKLQPNELGMCGKCSVNETSWCDFHLSVLNVVWVWSNDVPFVSCAWSLKMVVCLVREGAQPIAAETIIERCFSFVLSTMICEAEWVILNACEAGSAGVKLVLHCRRREPIDNDSTMPKR